MASYYDDYYIESDDDDDQMMCSGKQISSDSDENDKIADLYTRGIKKIRKKKPTDGNEFEREMSQELLTLMKSLTAPYMKTDTEEPTTSSGATSSKTSKHVKFKDDGQAPDSPSKYYDDIYFDTDDSEGDDEIPVNLEKKKQKRKFLSDDELLYDPKLDDEDQAWVDDSRRSYQLKPNKKLVVDGKTIPLPQSDAVLNCPACFTTLCHDCQRHEIYKSQYRAMFVFNCSINFSEKLHIPKKLNKKEKRRQKALNKSTSQPNADAVESQPSETSNSGELTGARAKSIAEAELPDIDLSHANPEDTFYPVHCSICNTKVAVYDQDEVYHFFNVITSY